MPWAPASSTDALVSSDDYVAWFNVDSPSVADTARITMAIDMASDAIRSETNQQLTVSTDTVTINQRTGACEIILPQWPVTSIASVVIDGNTLTETTDYIWSQTGVISPAMRSGYLWAWREWHSVVVTYTHGWNPVPRDLAGICLALAKRLFDTPGDQIIEKEALGSWSVTYAPLVAGLLDSEKYTLARYASWTNGY